MTVRCPQCGNSAEMTEENIGQLVDCVCGRRFVVGVEKVPIASFQNGWAHIKCPYCEAELSAPFESVGRNVRCEVCQGKFHVEGSAPKEDRQYTVEVEVKNGHVVFPCPRCGEEKRVKVTGVAQILNIRCRRCDCSIGAKVKRQAVCRSVGKIYIAGQDPNRNTNSGVKWVAGFLLSMFACLGLCICLSLNMDDGGYGKYTKDVLAYDHWLTYNGFGENTFMDYTKSGGGDHYMLCLNNHRFAFAEMIMLQQHSGRYWGPSSWPPGDVMEIMELRKRIYKYQQGHGLPGNNWVKVARERQ